MSKSLVPFRVLPEEEILIFQDGSTAPVIEWIDADEESCSPEEALACVAGSDEVGWFHLDLDYFLNPLVH